jgi:hypothetical protein
MSGDPTDRFSSATARTRSEAKKVLSPWRIGPGVRDFASRKTLFIKSSDSASRKIRRNFSMTTTPSDPAA